MSMRERKLEGEIEKKKTEFKKGWNKRLNLPIICQSGLQQLWILLPPGYANVLLGLKAARQCQL